MHAYKSSGWGLFVAILEAAKLPLTEKSKHLKCGCPQIINLLPTFLQHLNNDFPVTLEVNVLVLICYTRVVYA